MFSKTTKSNKSSSSSSSSSDANRKDFKSAEWDEYLAKNDPHRTKLRRQWYTSVEGMFHLNHVITVKLFATPFQRFVDEQLEKSNHTTTTTTCIDYHEFRVEWVLATKSEKHLKFNKWLANQAEKSTDGTYITWANRFRFTQEYKTMMSYIAKEQKHGLRMYLIEYSKLYNRYVKEDDRSPINIKLTELLTDVERKKIHDDYKSKEQAITIVTKKE